MAEADALAVSLQAFANRLALPTAAAADAFVRVEGWKSLGYARQSDYARERLDRTSRWLRQMAALGRAVASSRRLADAVTGEDGEVPIGMVKAVALASVTTVDGVESWISRAREVGVRQFERDVRDARDALRTAASTPRPRTLSDPVPARAATDDDVGDESRVCVRISMPLPVRAAFDEALDLHRAVSGGEASIGSYVEALVADFRAGADLGEDIDTGKSQRGGGERDDECRVDGKREGDGATPGGTDGIERLRGFDRTDETFVAEAPPVDLPPRGEREELLERNHLPAAVHAGADHPALGEARALLERAARVFAEAGEGDAERLDHQLRVLVGLEDELRRSLARLLLTMQDARLFKGFLAGRSGDSTLPFDSVGHYARARLGLSRDTAERLVRLARGLQRHDALARAYGEGRVTGTGASLVLRALGRAAAGEVTERAWIERAERATVRRLRDDVRWTVRKTRGVARACDPQPPDDATWYESLRREPGRSYEQIVLLGAEALHKQSRWTGLFLRLPQPLADDLRAALDAACRAISRDRSADWQGPGVGAAVHVTARDGIAEPQSPDLDAAGHAVARNRKAGRRSLDIDAAGRATARHARAGRRSLDIDSGEPSSDSQGLANSLHDGDASEPFSGSQGLADLFLAGVGAWEGLLRLLLKFAATYDPPHDLSRRRGRSVYERDGYRCAAPGCSSRSNLEDHHVQYRSRGGGDELANRVTLCRFHHQRGEHGDLMSVRGRAPLGLLFRLGRGRSARHYRNDMIDREPQPHRQRPSRPASAAVTSTAA